MMLLFLISWLRAWFGIRSPSKEAALFGRDAMCLYLRSRGPRAPHHSREAITTAVRKGYELGAKR